MPIFMSDIEKESNPDIRRLKALIMDALSAVKDPEIGVDIVNLGLIYGIEIDEKKSSARVKMTLTTPTCPYAGVLLAEIEQTLSAIEELEEIHVDLVWDPPWTAEMMSEKAKLLLGYHGDNNL